MIGFPSACLDFHNTFMALSLFAKLLMMERDSWKRELPVSATSEISWLTAMMIYSGKKSRGRWRGGAVGTEKDENERRKCPHDPVNSVCTNHCEIIERETQQTVCKHTLHSSPPLLHVNCSEERAWRKENRVLNIKCCQQQHFTCRCVRRKVFLLVYS